MVVVIVAVVIVMVTIVAVVIGAVVVATGPTITMVADDATTEGNDGRQKHGNKKQAFHG